MRLPATVAQIGAAVLQAAMIGTLFVARPAAAQAPERIELPAAQTDGGKPLMQALKARRSTRAFSGEPLPQQALSNLLWAAFGVNRAETGGRTAPSARNWQEIDVYVAKQDGLYLYEAAPHALRRVVAQDLRASIGGQEHSRTAPVTLIYVANDARMGMAGEETRAFYSAADTGFVAQNVYLYCASEGLGTVVFASIDRERLAKAMGLTPGQRITLAQSVGYARR
jgi:SagB-type dehydrogenase family enzyme